MHLDSLFQIAPIPPDAMSGTYNLYLVGLSYIMACLASFIALDITERIRAGSQEARGSLAWWLLFGAMAMGCGVWTMHFIGMQAFIMSMPMYYDALITFLSLVIAIVAAGFAFYLIKNENVKILPLALGGILMGLGICSMHYVGMAAMKNVSIHYLPGLFILSVIIAILASEAALCLMILGSKKYQYKQQLKIFSTLIMGLAICGMHYTGMAAAVFTPSDVGQIETSSQEPLVTPDILSFAIAAVTILIMSIALIASKYWVKVLQKTNKQLLEAEAILQQQSLDLKKMVEDLGIREERIRAILAAAGDGIIVTDEQGVIEICNRAAETIFNDSACSLLSQNVATYFGVTEDGEGRIQPLDIHSLTQKKGAIECLGIRKDQQTRPIELTISRSLLNNRISYIIVFRDIEQRKRGEADLARLNQQLLSTARLAGMAEVATSVLHNVGNVLNSINVSARILLERDNQQAIQGLIKASELVDENRSSLDLFFREHSVGQRFPEYLKQLAEYWNQECALMHKELESLNDKVHHIKSVVAMQQSLSGPSNVIEKISLDQLLEEAISINSETLERSRIEIVRDYEQFPVIEIDRVKVVQVLVNLLKNAAEALNEASGEKKILTLRIKASSPDYVQVEVTDNGKGIKPEDLTRIFSYGFTTKVYGHGFGLHSSSLTVQGMGGTLKAYSDGPNQGATFILLLPTHADAQQQEHKNFQIAGQI